MYIDALKNSGFKEDFRYLKENITNEITKENNKYDHKNKNRKRKIIWFYLPFCKLANINVGKYKCDRFVVFLKEFIALYCLLH